MTTSRPETSSREAPRWPPFVLAVAPNGARRGKADHPAIPLTPDELAATATACLDAGACMMHMHVRDSEGRHTLDADAYRDATAAVRRAVGDEIIVQVTSEAVGMYSAGEQMQMVRDVRPEAVSMAIRELMPEAGDEAEAGRFLAWLIGEGIQPQYILYSADEVARFQDLVRRGVIPGERLFVLYVLGRYAKGQVSHPADLLPFLEVAGSMACHWGFCAFGPRDGATATMVAALGGHARVGFENNRWLNDGSRAPDNAALVAQASAAARLIGRPLASAADARAYLAAPPPADVQAELPSALAELAWPAAAGGAA